MSDLWTHLPAFAPDLALLIVLLLPALVLGLLVLRGFATAPLVRGLLWRFRWPNVMFVALIAVSVGMGLGLIAQERGLRYGTAQAADKFDMIVSAPGSEMNMMLATVFLQPTIAPLLDGPTYSRIAHHDRVAIAAPLAYGDSYRGAPIVGTIADFVTHLSDGAITGRLWQAPFEAVIGADVTLEPGAQFTPAHGFGSRADTNAHGDAYTVVGRMARSGSPWDKAILVPVEAVWAVHGLANGHAPDAPTQLGPPFDPSYFPGTPAVVIQPDSLAASYSLRASFTRDRETMAFFPGAVLAEIYKLMGDVRQAMSLMSLVTQVLVASSVLLGLFILTRLFQRQMALLRALGAPGRFVLAVVWRYAATLLIAGALLGIGVGLAAATMLSHILTLRTGIAISALPGWTEMHLVAGFVSATLLLSLLPAWTVLRRDITSGLRA